VLTGQHDPQRLHAIFELFGVQVEMPGENKAMTSLAKALSGILEVADAKLDAMNTALLIVQGDTTTAYAGANLAFYNQVPLAHIEAGLTTGNINHPFPEEFHRQHISEIARLLFAPSQAAEKHARALAQPEASVFCTGNPVVDAMKHLLPDDSSRRRRDGRKTVLVTLHRRELHGATGGRIGQAIADLAGTVDARFVFVKHQHPGLRQLNERVTGCGRIDCLDPLRYPDFLNLISRSDLVITDSGGLQEEASYLRVPVLVVRNETERQEVVHLGGVRLVGIDANTLLAAVKKLLGSPGELERMKIDRNRYPYGDGRSSARISHHIFQWLRRRDCEEQTWR